jgi:hypothetical protein
MERSKGKLKILLPLFFLLVTTLSYSQTNRYWPVNFDQESFLLSGAVVAGGSSLGSIYYNPASVAFMDNAKISLNSSIFSFNWFVFKNGLGEGRDVRLNQIAVLPPYVSFLLKSKKSPRLSVELAVFTKEDQDLYVQEGFQSRGDFIPAISGEEVQDVFYNYSQRFVNLWIGAGLGYKLTENLSIGLSNFILVKSNRYINSLDISAYSTSDTLIFAGVPARFFSSSVRNQEVTQSFNGQLRWKFGLTYKHDRGSLGLTLTTPSLNVVTSARSALTISSTNLINEEGELVDDVIIKDQDRKLRSDFKDPFSIAIGATYLFPRKNWEVYFTAEFFAGISRYRSIEGRSNPDASQPKVLEQVRTDDVLTQFRGAVPVLNVAVGLKHPFPNQNSLILGARTDFSSLRGFDFGDAPSINIPIQANYDVFHLSSGYQFVFLKTRWVVGVEYALGRREADFQFVNLPEERLGRESRFPDASAREPNMQVRFNSISLFLGFDFQFGKGGG